MKSFIKLHVVHLQFEFTNQHAILDGKHRVIQLPEGVAYFEELSRQLTPDLQRFFIGPMLGKVISDELREGERRGQPRT